MNSSFYVALPDEPRLALLQEAGRLLLSYNMRTSPLRSRLETLASVLGLQVQVAVGYRNLTIHLPGGVQLHAQAPEYRINIAVTAAVLKVIDSVCAGELLPPEALKALASVEAHAERHHRGILALIFAAGASALAALFSADAAGIIVTGVASGLGLLLRQEMAKRHVLLFALPFSAALLGSVLGGFVIAMGWTQSPGICLIVPALMLVPGPHLINGLYDVIENNMQTGIPRLMLAIAILAAAAMGIFLGAWLLLGMTTVPPWHGTAEIVPLWLDVLLAGVAACSFGAFYNAPWRVLWTSILCGMVGHGIRYVALEQGSSLEAATLMACFAIGVMASRMVDRLRVPFAAVAFAGAVPMMPGVLMFLSIGGAMEIAALGAETPTALMGATLASIFQSVFVVGAMGLGLLLGARVQALALRPFSKDQIKVLD